MGPIPVYVVARVKLGEVRRDGFRGNYVSLVSLSEGGRQVSRIIGDVLLLLLVGNNRAGPI